jgi:hypothetical protein
VHNIPGCRANLAYLTKEGAERQVLKLATWLRKHQDESLPDGSKGQLMECIQLYHKTALAEPELKVSVAVCLTQQRAAQERLCRAKERFERRF